MRDAEDASWAFRHPEKMIDFGYRALHETAQSTKSLIEPFYSKLPQRSFYDSCSNSGREGLIEAQQFPEDFDGILAGAPANFWTHLVTAAIDISKACRKHVDRSAVGWIESPHRNMLSSGEDRIRQLYT